MGPGWSDALRRVRWGNVAPFAVILVAGALLLTGPRAAHEPALPLPPPAAQPDPVRAKPVEAPAARAEPEERPARRAGRKAQRRRPRAHRRRRTERKRSSHRPAPAAPVAPIRWPAPAWRRPRPTPEQLEFAPLG